MTTVERIARLEEKLSSTAKDAHEIKLDLKEHGTKFDKMNDMLSQLLVSMNEHNSRSLDLEKKIGELHHKVEIVNANEIDLRKQFDAVKNAFRGAIWTSGVFGAIMATLTGMAWKFFTWAM